MESKEVREFNRAMDRYYRMYQSELKSVNKYCRKCEPMVDMIRNLQKNGEVDMQKLGDLRKRCTYCKCDMVGIYKADAIIGALRVPVGTGRKSVIKKKQKEAIYEQIDKGVSYKEIAKRVGVSEKTVYRLNKERKNQGNQEKKEKGK